MNEYNWLGLIRKNRYIQQNVIKWSRSVQVSVCLEQ